MLIVSVALAVLALLAGWVKPGEVPGLLDLHVLSLFFVLIVGVALATRSNLFAFGVRAVLARVSSSRRLAVAAILTAGVTAALVTNDVALLLVVPFTLAFEVEAPAFEAAAVVILEIAAANLIGSISPMGNPQNLFLYVRGGFTPSRFFAAQAPWVLGMGAATLLVAPFVVPARKLTAPSRTRIRVEPVKATASVVLVLLQLLAVFGHLPVAVPPLAALPVLLFLGGLKQTDFSLVAVFAALFIGVEGLRRSPLSRLLDPTLALGRSAQGLSVSGALLSQVVSNVPAALLLAPVAASSSDPRAFTGLLYGVNAGGSGTPISSLASLIGARIYLAGRRRRGRFWRLFFAVSGTLLAVGIALSLALLKYSAGSR